MAFERGPYLITAAFCEQVIEDKSGALSLIRIVDRLNIAVQGPNAPVDMPPTALNWHLVITLKSGDVRGTHEVKVETILPSGEARPPLLLPVHLEGGNRGQNIVGQMNFVLTMPGIYWFRIYFDSEFLTAIPLEAIYSRTVTPRLA